ncbi:MAG: tRNA lysidine(34) synthetase TilS [Gemmatimonadales bacterium]
MTGLEQRADAAFAALGIAGGRVLVAVSGGTDSLALLLLTTSRAAARRLEVIVGHFDHGMQAGSAEAAARVGAVAAELGVAFEMGQGRLGPGTTETTARAARLGWLESTRERLGASWILTAHHADDQIETLLMRFLHGSGPDGLVGIQASRGWYRRPLLGERHSDLVAYLALRGVVPWEDPSNADGTPLRNWLRHTLRPILAERFPDHGRDLANAAARFEANRAAWDRLVDELPGLDFERRGTEASVAAASLAGYSSVVVRGLVRALGHRVGVPLGRGALERVQTLLAEGHTGQCVDLVEGWRAALEFGRLELFRDLGHPHFEVRLPEAGAVVAAERWRFAAAPGPAPAELERAGTATWVPVAAPLRFRPWQPGDRIRPLGGTGSRLVVRCMQERKVPRHRRPSWPVLVSDNEVVWVPGVCRSGAWLPPPGETATRIDVSTR